MMQPPPYGNSRDQLLARLRKQVRDQNLEETILALLTDGFEKALAVETLVLSRQERQKLFQTLVGEVLSKVAGQIDKGNHA